MYIKRQINGKLTAIVNPIDPLQYLDKVQDNLNRICYSKVSINNIKLSFNKLSRVCRNIIITEEVKLCKKFNIKGALWGLLANRSIYYLNSFYNYIDSLYNFDYCNKEEFRSLELQQVELQKLAPEKNIKFMNSDIFSELRNENIINPSIIELDGMRILPTYYKDIKFIINNRLNKESPTLVALTSSVGRAITQEQYEKERINLVKLAESSGKLLHIDSIAYAEQKHYNGPHYPMRVELMVFNS